MQLEPHLDTEWLEEFPPEHGMLLHFVRSGLGFPQPNRIGVAVSGGGDSMALLHAVVTLAKRAGWYVQVVTVDHQIRDESAKEAEFVSAFCAAKGIAHETLQWNGKEADGNFHKAAREARYRLIADWAKSNALEVVALGHTADDIAENFLIRLQRKSGADGLAAMKPWFKRFDMNWARPLWQQNRSDLRDYLRFVQVDWIDDPSNENPKYLRTQVRKALDTLSGLGIDRETLLRVSTLLSHEASALKHATKLAGHQTEQIAGDIEMPFLSIDIHSEIQQRLLKNALRYVATSDYTPKAAKIYELESKLHSASQSTLNGCLVTMSKEKRIADRKIRITREYNAVKDTICKTTEIWDGRWSIDGPHSDDLEVRALGQAVKDCPDWRDTGMPRHSLMSSPSIWRGDTLISAPLAGFNTEWRVRIEKDFQTFLLSH